MLGVGAPQRVLLHGPAKAWVLETRSSGPAPVYCARPTWVRVLRCCRFRATRIRAVTAKESGLAPLSDPGTVSSVLAQGVRF